MNLSAEWTGSSRWDLFVLHSSYPVISFSSINALHRSYRNRSIGYRFSFSMIWSGLSEWAFFASELWSPSQTEWTLELCIDPVSNLWTIYSSISHDIILHNSRQEMPETNGTWPWRHPFLPISTKICAWASGFRHNVLNFSPLRVLCSLASFSGHTSIEKHPKHRRQDCWNTPSFRLPVSCKPNHPRSSCNVYHRLLSTAGNLQPSPRCVDHDEIGREGWRTRQDAGRERGMGGWQKHQHGCFIGKGDDV